jgi:hypothetical protein
VKKWLEEEKKEEGVVMMKDENKKKIKIGTKNKFQVKREVVWGLTKSRSEIPNMKSELRVEFGMRMNFHVIEFSYC